MARYPKARPQRPARPEDVVVSIILMFLFIACALLIAAA